MSKRAGPDNSWTLMEPHFCFFQAVQRMNKCGIYISSDSYDNQEWDHIIPLTWARHALNWGVLFQLPTLLSNVWSCQGSPCSFYLPFSLCFAASRTWCFSKLHSRNSTALEKYLILFQHFQSLQVQFIFLYCSHFCLMSFCYVYVSVSRALPLPPSWGEIVL